MDNTAKVFVLIVVLIGVWYLWGNPLTIKRSVQDVSPGVVNYRQSTSSLYVRMADGTTNFTDGFLKGEVFLFRERENSTDFIASAGLVGQQYSIIEIPLGTRGYYIATSGEDGNAYARRGDFFVNEDVVYLDIPGRRKGFVDARVFNGVDQISDWRDLTTQALDVSSNERLKLLSVEIRENAVNRQFGNKLAGGFMFLVGCENCVYAELSSAIPLTIRPARVPAGDNETYRFAFRIEKELVNFEKLELLPKIQFGYRDPDSSDAITFKIRDYDLFMIDNIPYSGVEDFDGNDLGTQDLEIRIPLR